MKDDPIVDAARKAGRAFFSRFNGDLDAAFEELRRQTQEVRRCGGKVVSLPSRKRSVRAAPARKVG